MKVRDLLQVMEFDTFDLIRFNRSNSVVWMTSKYLVDSEVERCFVLKARFYIDEYYGRVFEIEI